MTKSSRSACRKRVALVDDRTSPILDAEPERFLVERTPTRYDVPTGKFDTGSVADRIIVRRPSRSASIA